MPETAQTLTDRLLRRLRDPDAIGFSRDFVRSILSDCQRFVNGAMRVTRATETLATNPHQMFYNISQFFPDILRIETVFEDTRDLKKTSIQALVHLDLKWFRHTGDEFTMWAPVGRDIVLIYPAKKVESSVTLRYTKLTDAFADNTVAVEMPDQFVPEILDLGELIFQLKERAFDDAKPVIEQFQARIGKFSANVDPQQ